MDSSGSGRDLWWTVTNVTVELQVLQNMLYQKGHNMLGFFPCPLNWTPASGQCHLNLSRAQTERNCEGLDTFFIQNKEDQ